MKDIRSSRVAGSLLAGAEMPSISSVRACPTRCEYEAPAEQNSHAR